MWGILQRKRLDAVAGQVEDVNDDAKKILEKVSELRERIGTVEGRIQGMSQSIKAEIQLELGKIGRTPSGRKKSR